MNVENWMHCVGADNCDECGSSLEMMHENETSCEVNDNFDAVEVKQDDVLNGNNEWKCDVCTFVNNALNKKYDICGNETKLIAFSKSSKHLLAS